MEKPHRAHSLPLSIPLSPTPIWASFRPSSTDLLSTAKDQLQLFAGHEFDALQRLHNDQNHYCAHPAFVTEEELFQPSLELARSHIVHALQILLVQAPLQGKSAVARFEADILSPSFPALPDAVERYMRSKYLDRAKDALVTNLIKRVLTAPFGAERAIFAGKERHLALVLGSIAAAKTAIYDLTSSALRSHRCRRRRR